MRKTHAGSGAAAAREVRKPDEQWRRELTPLQYSVLRRAHTERPFTGEYVHNHQDGFYRCAGCGSKLFGSDAKFDSGTGWPSFSEPAVAEAVELRPDGIRFGAGPEWPPAGRPQWLSPAAGGADQRGAAGLAMAFKLIESAQDRWRAVNAPHLVALVRAGARFERGVLVERPAQRQRACRRAGRDAVRAGGNRQPAGLPGEDAEDAGRSCCVPGSACGTARPATRKTRRARGQGRAGMGQPPAGSCAALSPIKTARTSPMAGSWLAGSGSGRCAWI